MKLFLFFLFFLITILSASVRLEKNFDYPKYSYSRNMQLEDRLKNLQYSCESNVQCSIYLKESASNKNCVLKCISKKCYDKIYAFDPLEDGEIDQRYKSFKGCVANEN